MSQAEPLSVNELEQAFEVFSRVSAELDTTYRELESKVGARMCDEPERSAFATRVGQRLLVVGPHAHGRVVRIAVADAGRSCQPRVVDESDLGPVARRCFRAPPWGAQIVPGVGSMISK